MWFSEWKWAPRRWLVTRLNGGKKKNAPSGKICQKLAGGCLKSHTACRFFIFWMMKPSQQFADVFSSSTKSPLFPQTQLFFFFMYNCTSVFADSFNQAPPVCLLGVRVRDPLSVYFNLWVLRHFPDQNLSTLRPSSRVQESCAPWAGLCNPPPPGFDREFPFDLCFLFSPISSPKLSTIFLHYQYPFSIARMLQ